MDIYHELCTYVDVRTDILRNMSAFRARAEEELSIKFTLRLECLDLPQAIGRPEHGNVQYAGE